MTDPEAYMDLVPDEVAALREENARLRAEVDKRNREWREAIDRAGVLMQERDVARAEVARLEGASVHDPGRLKEALRRVLTEAGMQAHKHGCPNRLVRPARWDEHRPCAGCEAEAALIDTVVAKEG